MRLKNIARTLRTRAGEPASIAAFSLRRQSPMARDLTRALVSPGRFIKQSDRPALAQIERLRMALASDATPLAVTDYGAGSPETSILGRKLRLGSFTLSQPATFTPMLARELARVTASLRSPEQSNLKSLSNLATNLGISAACIGSALSLDGDGRLFTIEGGAPLADLAGRNLKSLGLSNVEVVQGRFVDVLPDVLARSGPVDLAFIDGHHDGAATIDYFYTLLHASRPGAVLAFDDIHWSASMTAAWRQVSRHADVEAAVSAGGIGFAIVR